MPKTKTQIEAPERSEPLSSTIQEPHIPDKLNGPLLVPETRSAALPPPNGLPSEARAAEMMSSSQPMPGAASRARMMSTMQRTVGNARLSRMLQGTSEERPGAVPVMEPPGPAVGPVEPEPAVEETGAVATPEPEQTLPEAPAPTTPAQANRETEAPESAARTESEPGAARAVQPRKQAPQAAGLEVQTPTPAEVSPVGAPEETAEVTPEETPEPEIDLTAGGETTSQEVTPEAEAGLAAGRAAAPEAAALAMGAPEAVAGTPAGVPAGGPAGRMTGGPGPGAPPPEPQIDASSSEGLLQSLATVPASSLGLAINKSKAALPQIQAEEKSNLESSFPEVERPSGLPRLSNKAKPEESKLEKGTPPEAEQAGSREGQPPESQHQEPVAPVPGSRVSTEASEPSDEAGGSWWEWLVNRVRSFLSSIPTRDPGVSTSAGSRPRVDLTGDADPGQNLQQKQSSDSEVSTRRLEADQATQADFGENDIYPTVPRETLRPSYKPTSPSAARGGGGEAAPPALPGEARMAFDQNTAPWLNGKVNEQIEQRQQDRADYQQQSQEVRDEGQLQIAEETERVRADQEAMQQQARGEVDAGRAQWREENRRIQDDYAIQSQAKRAEIDQQIGTKVQVTEAQAEQELTKAEARAEAERIAAETQAANKKQEAQNQPRSWWQRFKGAVSDAFAAIKKAVNDIFDALRKKVKEIIEAAKTLVRGIIEAARAAIVGLIRAFGEAIKVFVSIALVAFPDAAARARDWIDGKVNGAVDAVNQAAETLKAATDAILDWIGAGLDAALTVLQAAMVFALDVLEFLAVGFLEVLELLAKLQDLIANAMPIIETIVSLIKDPTPVIEAIKEFIGLMIAQVPEMARSVAVAAVTFSPPPKNHWEGIWRHLEPKLAYLANNWWDVLKSMAWHLIWPFAEDSPLWDDVSELWDTIGKAFNSIWNREVSKAIDEILRVSQLVVSIVGLFYGWIFVGLVIGFGIAGGVAGVAAGGAGAIPGAIAGAGAGAGIAAEIGYGLLIAAAAVETAIMVKAGIDLVFTEQTEEENEEDYERVASSALTLAIMGAMALLGAFAARFARAIISRIARFVRGKKAPTAVERRAAMTAEAVERARVAKIEEGIRQLDADIAGGRKTMPREDLDWLDADPARKRLAYDDAVKSYRVTEAKAALAAEQQGVLPKPVRRATKEIDPNADFIDGNGKTWNHKGTGPGESVADAVATITRNAKSGTNVLADLSAMSPADQAAVRIQVSAQLSTVPDAGQVRFLPPGPIGAVVGGGVVGKEISDETNRRSSP